MPIYYILIYDYLAPCSTVSRKNLKSHLAFFRGGVKLFHFTCAFCPQMGKVKDTALRKKASYRKNNNKLAI